jgi:hypothetical protein
MDPPAPFPNNDNDDRVAARDQLRGRLLVRMRNRLAVIPLRRDMFRERRAVTIRNLFGRTLDVLILCGVEWASGVPEQLMHDRQQIFSALETNRTVTTVFVDSQFLAAASEEEHRRLYRALGDIPTLVNLRPHLAQYEAIFMTDLLGSLPRLVDGIHVFGISNIALNSDQEVELLANAVGSRGDPLGMLTLDGIVNNVDAISVGFLDPILFAMRCRRQQPAYFYLCGYGGRSEGTKTSLVTVRTLRLFLQSTVEFIGENQRSLGLKSLGLGDDHCKAVAELLVKNDGAPEGSFGSLDLEGNPAIGQEGCEAILGLLNRNHWIETVLVDDASWSDKFRIVADMNTEHGRGEFLQDGAFHSKADWVNWLARLAGLEENDETETDNEEDDETETDDARILNFLWYTLREKPELICR